jgi:catechol 2,3-dioxygenase-like lactoylglutathione lyase family enzyme
MTVASPASTTRVVFNAIEPQFFVTDINRACDFYTSKLGFAVAFTYGNPPFYAQVVRDNARINLRHVDEAVFSGDIRQRERLLAATITVASVDEINQLFLSYHSAGVSFQQVLKKEPWGATTFVVSDPDENLILFAGPATD